MPVLPRVYVAPPDIEPYEQGLIGATQQLATDDIHWLIGGVEWDSLANYVAELYQAGAYLAGGTSTTTSGGAGGSKTWQSWKGTSKAWPFAVYAGIQCGTIGYTPDEFEARALRALELSEQFAAELALWTGAGGESPALNQTGVHDVTAGTATELITAVGLLENWLAANYGGRGQIHAQRSIAGLASSKQLIKPDPVKADRVATPLGTRWVFGGGYDGTGPAAVAPADAGKTWIYITGQTVMQRGPIELPADFEHSIRKVDNQEFVLAERPYIIGVDGSWAAALVDLTAI